MGHDLLDAGAKKLGEPAVSKLAMGLPGIARGRKKLMVTRKNTVTR